MITWMAYVTVVGCVAGAAGLLAEHGLRLLGRPVRWAWAGAMAVTVAVPVLASAGVVPDALRGSAPGLAPGLTRIGIEIPAAAGSPTVEVLLITAWAAVSLVLLASVRLSSWTVRRNERSWRRVRTGAHATVVSSSFGPGVIGARRPRIVLPEWVLGAAPSLRHLIVRHEEEHVRARDTTLLLGAVAVVVLLPWCLPLWWQLHRLRCAVEIDCDARVLAATRRPREYAGALVEVAGRRSRGLLPAPPFALRGRELERRILLVTHRARLRSPAAGTGLLVAAAVLVIAVAAMVRPAAPVATFDNVPSVIERPPGASVYLRIEPGAPDLLD